MAFRLVVVLALVALFAAAVPLHRRRQQRLQAGPESHPLVPATLRVDAKRTWVVFTTPLCASCAPVAERLRRSDPEARVVTVDATREPGLAGAFAVRSAPTALLADAEGRVQARLVGPEAVARYVSSDRSPPSGGDGGPSSGRRAVGSSARRGFFWSRTERTGSATPQSAPMSGSSQATPSSSSGL